MSSPLPKSSIRINKSELLCKQGCGFYGNHQWEGFCSKCWREVKTKEDKSKLRFPKPNIFGLGETLNEKRKLAASNVRASAVSTLFGKSKDQQASKFPIRQTSRESIQVGKEFVQFLKTLNQNEITQDVSHQVSLITDKLYQLCDSATIDEISEAAVNFYQEMTNRIQTKSFYQSLSLETSTQLQDLIERYITTRLYNKFFSPPSSDDEEMDLLLQSRIRSLHWISVHILDTDIDETQAGVSEEVEAAITAIIEVNSKRSPIEKLNQIVECSNHILSALRLTKQGLASADDFLPALIYIVLKANPPLFESNIRFITRFAIPNRLMSGEPGYYFTNMCCAVSFIRDLNASSLSMPQSEFDSCMNGDSLPYDPRLSLQRQRECLALMQSNMRMVSDLKSSQEALMSQAMQLQQDVIDFCSSFTQQVQNVCHENPLMVRERKRKVDLDADTEDSILLPPPIQPQLVYASNLNQFSMPRSTSRTLDLLPNPIVCTNVVDFNNTDIQIEDTIKSKLPSLDSLSKLFHSLDDSSSDLIRQPNFKSVDLNKLDNQIKETNSDNITSISADKDPVNSMLNMKIHELVNTGDSISSFAKTNTADGSDTKNTEAVLNVELGNTSQLDDDPFILLTQEYDNDNEIIDVNVGEE